MRVLPTAVFIAVAAAAVLIAVPASAQPAQPRETLQGFVRPDATIGLRHADGRTVTNLDAGQYTIVVEDTAIDHNFHLFGAGVEQTTAVERAETVTWTVNFVDGQRYQYVCDPHSSFMRGSFTVGNVQPPPTSAPVRRLNATVTSRAIAVRTTSGSRARSVAAGRYRIAVRDMSRAQNFHLIGPGVNRRTTVGGTTKPTWTVTLRRGTYSYRSDANRRLRGSFRVP